MGLIRKTLSASTLGLVDFRSDKERIARSGRRTDKGIQQQNKLIAEQNKLIAAVPQQPAPAPARQAPPAALPAGWYADVQQPHLVRWWDGTAWTPHTQPAF
jgi:hypothetical protein